MAWPPHIQELADRIQKVLADLQADMESTASGHPYDVRRRNKLTQELIESEARFLNEVLEQGANGR